MIDLRATFPRVRVRGGRSPWSQAVPCRFGMVYPHGGDRLVAVVPHEPSSRALSHLGACEYVATADGDAFVFAVGVADAVFAILGPERPGALARTQRVTTRETA